MMTNKKHDKKNKNIIEVIQEKSLTALGAVVTNGHNLNPETLIPILVSLQNITKTKNTANDQKLIGSTLDCVGNIITVIKPYNFFL